MPIMYKRH